MQNYPESCPRYHRCSVNRCPVSPALRQLSDSKYDPERTCKEHINTRLAIAQAALQDGVTLQALTDEERRSGKPVAALAAQWDERDQKRKERASRLRAHRAAGTPDPSQDPTEAAIS